MAAFFAQLPGNLRWRTRPALTKSINAVGFAAKHGIPAGQPSGRWGAPIVMLRTTADTEYAFHFQVQGSAQIPAEDLANCLIFGPAGSGKTGLLGSVCLLALRNAAARVVIVDKDYGLSVMVRAAGGSYLVLPSGSPSGLAPLHGLTGAGDDLAFLERFVRGLILSDGQGDLSSDEDQRLQRAVARQMDMPSEMRGLAGVAVMLGQAPDNQLMASILTGLPSSALAGNNITSTTTVGQWRQSVTSKIGDAASQPVLIGA